MNSQAVITNGAPNSPERWIVLGSANGSTNLGDECMWQAAAQTVRAQKPTAKIITDAGDGWEPPVDNVEVLPNLALSLRRGRRFLGETLSRQFPLAEALLSRPFRDRFARKQVGRSLSEPRDDLQRLWSEAIQKSTGIIVSGAGAINDDYAVHGIHAWHLIVEWAHRFGKPVHMVGQGVGPVRRSVNTSATRRLLSLVDLLTVRESTSADVVRSLGVTKAAAVTPDWAIINIPTQAERERAATIAKRSFGGDPFLTVSLHRRHSTSKRAERMLSDFLKSFAHAANGSGYGVLFVSNMTAGRYSDDRETASRLLKPWAESDRDLVTVQPDRLSPGTTRALLGLSQGLVSSRYHPMIFALAEGVGAYGISFDAYYDQKLEGASRFFGVSQNVSRLGSPSAVGATVVQALESLVPAMPTSSVLAGITAPLVERL